MKTKDIHISQVKQGDTILHNGEVKTLSGNWIKRGFMGVTIFGDSYQLGTLPVKLIIEL